MLAGTTEIDIWSRVVEESFESLSSTEASAVLKLHFPQAVIDRSNELSARVSSGDLTAEEVHELDRYIHVDAVLATMKAKARSLLRSTAGR